MKLRLKLKSCIVKLHSLNIDKKKVHFIYYCIKCISIAFLLRIFYQSKTS